MSRCQPAVLLIAAAIAFTACSETQAPLAEPSSLREEAAARDALRVKQDLARGRRWELGWGAVSAYDVASGQLVRRVPLPRASFAGTGFTCRPDMAMNRFGGLIVSSDAQPTLWRVSPSHFEIERFDIVVDSDREKDFGFSGLAWSADEKVLYAVSAAMGTLWRIDLESETARKVELSSPVLGACGLELAAGNATLREPPTLLVAIGSSDSLYRIFLSPDLARGVVEGY
jgi:hypothetical protein